MFKYLAGSRMELLIHSTINPAGSGVRSDPYSAEHQGRCLLSFLLHS